MIWATQILDVMEGKLTPQILMYWPRKVYVIPSSIMQDVLSINARITEANKSTVFCCGSFVFINVSYFLDIFTSSLLISEPRASNLGTSVSESILIFIFFVLLPVTEISGLSESESESSSILMSFTL